MQMAAFSKCLMNQMIGAFSSSKELFAAASSCPVMAEILIIMFPLSASATLTSRPDSVSDQNNPTVTEGQNKPLFYEMPSLRLRIVSLR